MNAFRIAAAIIAALWAALAAAASAPSHPAGQPFTRFQDTPSGGVESVLAVDRGNAGEVQRIRSRLATEAERFSNDELPRVAKLNGRALPALTELAGKWDRVLVTYTNVPGGARIAYTSGDPAVVAAIHDWFAARRSSPALRSAARETPSGAPIRNGRCSASGARLFIRPKERSTA
jgi:hypothetical protein